VNSILIFASLLSFEISVVFIFFLPPEYTCSVRESTLKLSTDADRYIIPAIICKVNKNDTSPAVFQQ
jgi:hypothetical protein